MGEVRFGAEESGANSGEEQVINEPQFETDGDYVKVTVSPEQADAVRKALAGEGSEQEANNEKPEWLGDFETPEEMAKAYKELRTKMSSGKAEEESTAEVEETAEKKGVDMGKYTEEWNVNGSLSNESYAELEKQGFSRDIVDNYIAGKVAVVEKATQGLYEAAGGEEAYATLIEWGKANLPKESQVAYDRLLNAGEFEAAALALRGFVQAYTDAEGSAPKGLDAMNQAGATGVRPFANKAEMIAAINSPPYKNGDKAFVAEVEKRILASNF